MIKQQSTFVSLKNTLPQRVKDVSDWTCGFFKANVGKRQMKEALKAWRRILTDKHSQVKDENIRCALGLSPLAEVRR